MPDQDSELYVFDDSLAVFDRSNRVAAAEDRGLSIEIGHGTTNVVPIYGVVHIKQGYTLPHAMHISNVGGADASQMLKDRIEDVHAAD